MVKGQRTVTPLRLAIVASGCTVKEVAEAANVRPNDLSRYALDRVQPKVEVATRIASTLGTTVEELWPGRMAAA